MKHLKKFNESQDQDLQIIKEYFYNITDDLEDICTVEFQKTTDNFFSIYFRLKNNRRKDITQNNLQEIDNWLKMNEEDAILLKEISSSLSTLQDEQILDNFTLSPVAVTCAYVLKIYTKLKTEEDVDNWFILNRYFEAQIDELRMKSWFKKNFNVEVSSFDEIEDYDKYDQRYLALEVKFSTPFDQEHFDKMKDSLLEFKSENTEEDISLKPFESVEHYSWPAAINNITCYLDSRIVF